MWVLKNSSLMHFRDEICLALGSNLGNRLENLRRAISSLEPFFLVHKISHVIETEALLLPDSPREWDIPYCNLVLTGETTLSPSELLAQIKKIEVNLGRDLKAPRWSPRVIDIDIVFYKDVSVTNDTLTIPHLGVKNREFLQYLLREIGSAEFSEVDYSALNHFVLSPRFVGIVNITPDSFSDGGKFFSAEQAESQVRKLCADGAALIDIGAQSTRPGFSEVPPSVEIARLDETLERCSDISESICVDTYFDEVAEHVMKKHNIKWINDQNSCLSAKTINMIAENNGKLIIMMHGTDISWFSTRIRELKREGMKDENILIDPGIGFGKSVTQNISAIKNINELKQFGHKILVGHSRKSFLSRFSTAPAAERDIETVAISEFLISAGVDYLRVHDVKKHMRFFTAKHCIESA